MKKFNLVLVMIILLVGGCGLTTNSSSFSHYPTGYPFFPQFEHLSPSERMWMIYDEGERVMELDRLERRIEELESANRRNERSEMGPLFNFDDFYDYDAIGKLLKENPNDFHQKFSQQKSDQNE